ncbi:hypothetical protein CL689_07165 [Candidatus Saccharibacteria bacterium]|nr:hypothetical protein [Candidatus Saccharibacteria bacterium]
MKKNQLITRDQFREQVFARDGHKCVFCGNTEVYAHHIIERRLWPDGGYYLANGASVCNEHHLECEQTTISVEQVREACGISTVMVPPHLYPDQPYDKWGNPVLSSGQRLRGELFFDESVQKILAKGGALDLFSNRVKYPRTHHLPWSDGVNDDDRVLTSISQFEGKRVIVTRKMDGENTSMYRDFIHARSIDGRSHPSRDWVKQFWSSISAEIPQDWRICGENLFAKHSIGYQDLPSYFLGFSIWNEKNICLDWDSTMEYFAILGITPVEVIYDGVFDQKKIQGLWDESKWEIEEGYLVRLASEIPYAEFRHLVGKFVRKGHVQTGKHWFYGQKMERNHLA